MPNEPKSSTTAPSISFEQFTESTIGAVLRAAQAHKMPHPPIVIGIIWNPQGLEGAPQPIAKPVVAKQK